MSYKILLMSALIAVSSHLFAGSLFLETSEGVSLGLLAENYAYAEPGVMKQKGGLAGLSLEWVFLPEKGQFYKIQGSYLVGRVDYTGSGTLNNEPVHKLELRWLMGCDLPLACGVISPYSGFGFRSLYNDGRGISSTGYWGYRRLNKTLYLPIGFNYSQDVGDYKGCLNGEFDLFLGGRQESMFQDGGGSQCSNNQHSGFGLRLGAFIEADRWSLGPYFQFWHIDDSDFTTIYSGMIGYEPTNHTSELGLELKWHL